MYYFYKTLGGSLFAVFATEEMAFGALEYIYVCVCVCVCVFLCCFIQKFVLVAILLDAKYISGGGNVFSYAGPVSGT